MQMIGLPPQISRFLSILYLQASCVLLLSGLSCACAGEDSENDFMQKALQASARGDHEQALGIFTEIIAKNPKQSMAFYWRGRENFRAGKIKESVSDLDKYVELAPKEESRQ